MLIIKNHKYLDFIMEEKAFDVTKRLRKEINRKDPQKKIFIQYKGFDGGETGDCEFEFVEKIKEVVYYEFVGTMS